jgi:hypothetical protein
MDVVICPVRSWNGLAHRAESFQWALGSADPDGGRYGLNQRQLVTGRGLARPSRETDGFRF